VGLMGTLPNQGIEPHHFPFILIFVNCDGKQENSLEAE